MPLLPGADLMCYAALSMQAAGTARSFRISWHWDDDYSSAGGEWLGTDNDYSEMGGCWYGPSPVVPEPGSLALTGLGLPADVGVYRRRARTPRV